MATSRIQALRTQLVTSWTTQLTSDGITGVTVTGYDPADQATKTDQAWVHDITTTQSLLTFSGTRDETLRVEGKVWVLKPGAGQTVANDAETRALTILGSLETILRTDTDLNSVILFAEIVEVTSSPMAIPDGQLCVLSFELAVTANL